VKPLIRQYPQQKLQGAVSSSVRSSPLGANTVVNTVGKPMSSFSDALFTQGLTALMPPTISQSVRDFVTEI